MAVDKRISVEPNEVGLGQKVEVIPFKPRPGSPFSTPEGIFDKPKPGVKPEDDKRLLQCLQRKLKETYCLLRYLVNL